MQHDLHVNCEWFYKDSSDTHRKHQLRFREITAIKKDDYQQSTSEETHDHVFQD